VHWVDPKLLRGNSYNPNRVFPTEMQLLVTSIVEDGWTQPIVVNPPDEEGFMEVVDGFHRSRVGLLQEVAALAGGLVPVVILKPADRVAQMAATVRHNRARGQHGVLKMGDIVRAAQDAGLSEDAIVKAFGMEPEEIDRLADMRSSPDTAGKDSFGRGWIPDVATQKKRGGAQKHKS
jgi:ParB-like chromosome segregation protein Spo0J